MMKYIFFNILAFLLILPFQTMNYVKTLAHVMLYEHGSHPSHEHSSHDHEDGNSEEDAASADLQDHSKQAKSSQAPQHNHNKEIFGFFTDIGVSSGLFFTELPTFVFRVPSLFASHVLVCKSSGQGLLRPPIA